MRYHTQCNEDPHERLRQSTVTTTNSQGWQVSVVDAQGGSTVFTYDGIMRHQSMRMGELVKITRKRLEMHLS